jgi:hypothetical protein
MAMPSKALVKRVTRICLFCEIAAPRQSISLHGAGFRQRVNLASLQPLIDGYAGYNESN